MTRKTPRYALYGENDMPSLPERMHCESIEERSKLHGWEILPHVHSGLYQILWLRRGACEAMLGDDQLKLKGPCLVLVPDFVTHGFKFSEQADGLVFTFISQLIDETLGSHKGLLDRLLSAQLIGKPALGRLPQILNALALEYFGVEGGRLEAVRGLLSYLLVHIARSTSMAAEQDPQGKPRSMHHGLAFSRLVEAHYRDCRQLGFYASQLRLSLAQMHRICRSEFGSSPLEFIHRRLQVEAERELAYTTLSVKEVALHLGFQDPAYFSRFFTKRVGDSPAKYRASAFHRAGGAAGRAK